jgi:hypothetical protein
MKRYVGFAAAVAAALSFGSSAASAADSCAWVRQPDGSNWGTCVKDNGQMYCQSCPADGTACSVVKCQ